MNRNGASPRVARIGYRPPAPRLSRRTLLRGAGAGLALPLLDAMLPAHASAQTAPRRFVGFFYPNGTDPRLWQPAAGALSAATLPPALQDLGGFAAEGIWPGEEALVSRVTAVTGIDHSGVSTDIHVPSMALSAHRGLANNYTPPEPTLDQFLASRIQEDTPYRSLALSATGSTDIAQGHISFREGGQTESVERNPRQLFDTLFAGGGEGNAAELARARQASLLDFVLEDAQRLQARLGVGDRRRVEQYMQSVYEVERQVAAGAGACSSGEAPEGRGNWHDKTRAFIDLAVLALSCDLTRVVTLQYSDSWGVHYGDYSIGEGIESLGSWSDHFISHKLDDTDRATDLDGISDRSEARRIADLRVVNASRFKVRRFANLLGALSRAPTPSGGSLLDESLVLYASENGDGDSHSRRNMPVLLAGGLGGFPTGRSVAAEGEPTGALHASIARRFGIDVERYGNPAGSPIEGL